MEKQGLEHYQLMVMAKSFKGHLNEDKLGLGMFLTKLQKFYAECERDGIEEFGTFKSCLAELHLNLRRSIKLLQNYQYLKQYDIPEDDYKYFDSSIIELIRRNQKDPALYLNDIHAGLSYTDLEKIISS